MRGMPGNMHFSFRPMYEPEYDMDSDESDDDMYELPRGYTRPSHRYTPGRTHEDMAEARNINDGEEEKMVRALLSFSRVSHASISAMTHQRGGEVGARTPVLISLLYTSALSLLLP